MKTYKKPAVISADFVMQVRRATGMGIINAKHFLETASPLLYSRFVEALQTNNRGWSFLYDPIEDEPEFAESFKGAEREAEQELSKPEKGFSESSSATVHLLRRRGQTHTLQSIKQRILREKYNIEWFTWAEMNPGTHFSP
jgi:hypothetical protein